MGNYSRYGRELCKGSNVSHIEVYEHMEKWCPYWALQSLWTRIVQSVKCISYSDILCPYVEIVYIWTNIVDMDMNYRIYKIYNSNAYSISSKISINNRKIEIVLV